MAVASKTVSVSLPAELLSAVDRLASEEERTRSDLLREAIRQYAVSRRRWRELQEFGREQARKRGIRHTDVERVIEEYRQGLDR